MKLENIKKKSLKQNVACPISPVLSSLPDLEEVGRKSYVIAGERGELGSWTPGSWITVTNPEKSLLSGTWAVLSLYGLSDVDGRVSKEASTASQSYHLERYSVPIVVRPQGLQYALSSEAPAIQQCWSVD